MSLNEIKVGERVMVLDINKEAPLRQRFLDLGIVSGMKIKCVLESPFQNPKAYEIRGAVIAIRNEDANFIIVERSN